MNIGKYEILEPLGQGGFATVYRARDTVLARTVAIKVCQATDPETLERFVREARVTGNLQHPNIAQVFDFGVEGNVPFLVQEFLPGWDLSEIVRSGVSNLAFAVSVLVQVARGLAHAHARQIVHRDIKPSNIRVLPDGLVKILDFGIARLTQDDSRLTRTGEALGTVGYFAPEMLTGQPVDARADLFAFGVVAYELLTGKQPFLTGDLGRTLYAIVNHHPPPPHALRPDCPQELSALVMRCLAKDPNQRWPTAEGVAEGLEVLARRLGVEVGSVKPAPGGAVRLPPTVTVRAVVAKTQALWRAYRTPAALLAVGIGLVGLALAGLIQTAKNEELAPATFIPTPTAKPSTPLRAPVDAAPPPQQSFEVEFVVSPPAFVRVGDRELGKIARERVVLSSGPHRVVFWIPGYRTETRNIVVGSDTREVLLSMPPFGLLSVVPEFGTPVMGARAFLDDRPLGSLPVVNAKVPEGVHTLRVTWPDGAVFEAACSVKAEEAVTVAVSR